MFYAVVWGIIVGNWCLRPYWAYKGAGTSVLGHIGVIQPFYRKNGRFRPGNPGKEVIMYKSMNDPSSNEEFVAREEIEVSYRHCWLGLHKFELVFSKGPGSASTVTRVCLACGQETDRVMFWDYGGRIVSRNF